MAPTGSEDRPRCVILCAGPPECHLQDDDAARRRYQEAGCASCTRIYSEPPVIAHSDRARCA